MSGGQLTPGTPLVTTDSSTIIGTGTLLNPLTAIGAAPSGHAVLTSLRLSVEADPFGPGANMPAGVINNYADVNIRTGAILRWKGADNQGTILTGIDSTSINVGDIKVFWNQPELGLVDTGVVVFRHQDTGSTAANRFVLEHEKEYIVASGASVILMYGDDFRWHVVGNSGWAKHVVGQEFHAYPPLLVGFTTPITGTFNDWNPVGDPILGIGVLGIAGSNLAWRDHSLILVNTGAAGATVTGLFAATAFAIDPSNYSPIKFVTNTGAGPLILRNQDAGSLIQNQMQLPGNVDLILMPLESAIFTFDYYTGAGVQWHCLSVGRTNTETAVSPAALSSLTTIENWNPGIGRRIRVNTNDNGSILGGLVGALGTNNASCGYGERRILHNIGNGPLMLLHASAGSSTGNKFFCPGGRAFIVPSQGSVELLKDDSNQWKILDPTGPLKQITSTTPSGATNNWAPVDFTTGLPFKYADSIRMAGAGGPVTGLSSTGIVEGHRVQIINWTGVSVVFNNQNAGSSAANQILCPNQVDFTLRKYATAWLTYDHGGLWILEGA